jgi:tRNA wybutosine-synthesizing protein 4
MVVNLGCGYDPLPFAYIASGASAMFVDVDYPDLIRHKEKIIQQTPALIDCVEAARIEGSGEIASQSYRLVGCDLTDLSSLDEKLHALQSDLNNTDILFITEVAITYMVHRSQPNL